MEHKLESERKDRIAAELGLDPRQVAVWFENKLARWKSKKLEEEYSTLKTEHDSTVLEKCKLETELVGQVAQIVKVVLYITLLLVLLLGRGKYGAGSLDSVAKIFLIFYGCCVLVA